jgi:hypothetical protein
MIIELARLQKEWDAPIYVFFKPIPSIQYIQNRKAHVFECAASQCHCRTRFIRRFLDTRDARSTSNLRRHAKTCWGDEAIEAADGTRNIKAARAALQSLKSVNGSITAAFQRIGEGKAVYSHRQHTKTEARYANIYSFASCLTCMVLVAPNLSAGSQKITDHSKLSTIVAFDAS